MIKAFCGARQVSANSDLTLHSLIMKMFFLGDIGYFDQAGYLYLTDRYKDVIKYKGSQVTLTNNNAT